MEKRWFLEQYSKPRNMGFITAARKRNGDDKNSIRDFGLSNNNYLNGKECSCAYKSRSSWKYADSRKYNPDDGSAKLAGNACITITSIQYADNVIPVEMEVYDMDGMRASSFPNSDEVTAMKEIAANMGTSMGSSITITDDAGSQRRRFRA